MAIANERFRDGDVYIDYAFEDVMFRYEHASKRFFRKFYGDAQEQAVPFDNALLNEAIRGGVEVDAQRYGRRR